MNDTPDLRASDDERERTVALLREHSVAGRLTLEELTERTAAAYAATTRAELEQVRRDLPAEESVPAPRKSPTSSLFSIFSSSGRDGRIRLRGRLTCVAVFGSIDLDLRQATIEGDDVSVVAVCVFGSANVFVPEGLEVELSGLSLFGHKGTNGSDPSPVPGTPLIRIEAYAIFGSIDIWRVPVRWATRTWREVIRGFRSGEDRELKA